MDFEGWKKWKESQPTGSTCDYIGCKRPPVWRLVKNNVYFCAEHSGGILKMIKDYGEEPVYLHG